MARISKIDQKDLGPRVIELAAQGHTMREIAASLDAGIDHTMIYRWLEKNAGQCNASHKYKTALEGMSATASGQAFFDHLLAIVGDARQIAMNPGEPARVREKALEVAAACAVEGFNLASYKLQIEQIVDASAE